MNLAELRKNEFKDLLETNELIFIEKEFAVLVDLPTLGACTYYPKANKLHIHKDNKWELNGYYYTKNHLKINK